MELSGGPPASERWERRKVMWEKSKAAEYLRRAAEAENLAASGPDDWARDQWMKIALGYRELAQKAVSQNTHEAVSEQPEQQAASQAVPGTSVTFHAVPALTDGDREAGWTIERREPDSAPISIGRIYSSQQGAEEEAQRLNHEIGGL